MLERFKMNQVETKQYKSIYHIFIWIAVFSLIMIGLLEWGYIERLIWQRAINGLLVVIT